MCVCVVYVRRACVCMYVRVCVCVCVDVCVDVCVCDFRIQVLGLLFDLFQELIEY